MRFVILRLGIFKSPQVPGFLFSWQIGVISLVATNGKDVRILVKELDLVKNGGGYMLGIDNVEESTAVAGKMHWTLKFFICN